MTKMRLELAAIGARRRGTGQKRPKFQGSRVHSSAGLHCTCQLQYIDGCYEALLLQNPTTSAESFCAWMALDMEADLASRVPSLASTLTLLGISLSQGDGL